MKKLIALLFVLFLSANVAYAIKSYDFDVGRDIAPGLYTVELYKANENSTFGIAVCGILRQVEGSYKYETIQTEDMTLTDENPACELTLIDGDILMISCSDDYNVRLLSPISSTVEDKYPNAIDGVNLTMAINRTLSVIERYPDVFTGLDHIDIEYNDVLPSLQLTMQMEDGHKGKYEDIVRNVLFLLNIACCAQNSSIRESGPLYYGGIYDNMAVIIGVYDSMILFTDTAFDIYYILPGSYDIVKYE